MVRLFTAIIGSGQPIVSKEKTASQDESKPLKYRMESKAPTFKSVVKVVTFANKLKTSQMTDSSIVTIKVHGHRGDLIAATV